ncbi:MAG: branched-chain amino acid ABC transporter permease [Verrucomicrobia bacterium]|nr:branched-chain amino acid ABC transporter permease [Verrucomicrobiota bacterium]
MTEAVRIERSTRTSRVAGVAGFILLVVLVAAPFYGGRSELYLLVEIFSYLALASLWNLLAGYTGLVSVGQQAFVGLGGYSLFTLTIFFGVTPLLAVLLAGAVAALFAIPTAWIIFRLKGAYFAIGTWVVAEVYRLTFAQVSILGGGSGSSLPSQIVQSIAPNRLARDNLIYWTGLAVVIAVLATIYLILRSRWGLALTAIRDSEPAAESVGVDNYRTKFLVYLLTAGATGSVGALISLQKLRISPDAAFSVNDWTAFVIFIVVIGGIGRMEGPLLGALVFFLLREFFADWGPWYLMLLGLFAILITLTMPKGIAGLLADRFDIQIFPLRRRVRLRNSQDTIEPDLTSALGRSQKS